MAGFMIFVKVPELKNELNNISKYNEKQTWKLQNAVANSTKNIARGARQRAHVVSGDLKKSIGSRFDKKTITGTAYARSSTAHLEEFGVKPATVKPVNAKVLKIGESYAMIASIPARSGHPFMRPAYEDEQTNFIKNVKEAVKP